LDLLHEAARLPKSRFPVDWGYVSGWGVPLGQIYFLQTAVQLLQLKVLLHQQAHEPELAAQTLETMVGLARVLAQEPFFPAQHLRSCFLIGTAQGVERLLDAGLLTAEQMHVLRDELLEAGAATPAVVSRMLIAERCLAVKDLLHPSQAQVWGRGLSGPQQFAVDAIDYSARVLAVPEQRTLEFLDGVDVILRQADALGTATNYKLLPQPTGGAQMLTNYWAPFIRQQTELIFRLRATALALAIEEYRALHGGSLPARLEELTPQFIPALPLDPFGSEQLAWKRVSSGYVIFSPVRGSPAEPASEQTPSWRVNQVRAEPYPGLRILR
jgi:hypothetical protein